MAVVAIFPDRSYSWRCEGCGSVRKEQPHRGPRKSVCKRCQNSRYLAGRSPSRIEFDRLDAARRSREYRQRWRRGGWEAW